MKLPIANRRRGSATPFVLMAAIALVLIGVAGYYLLTSTEDTSVIDPILVSVDEGEFVSQVLDQGEVQSSENVEIRCEVRARNGELNVLTVVPEGSRVESGDFLVQLDSTAFEKELEAQQIALVNAKTRVIQAESSVATAEVTLEEYIEGTFEQEKLQIENELKSAEAAIETAKQDNQQAKDNLAYSRKLMAKGYTTEQAFESAKFRLDQTETQLELGKNDKLLAEKKLKVLEDITYKKNTIQFQADIEAAKVQLDSEEKALLVEEETLAEIQEMIEKCHITVPEGVSGQVVYAKEQSRGGNDWILEEGTTVRQNQVLIRLPDPDKMEVKALINEQSITQIEPNMPATIKVDALNDVTLKGIVTKVNQYAESGGWMSSSVRKYAVFVRILDPVTALKPGMNASVTIQTKYLPNALLVPIQAVYAVQDKKYCLLAEDGGYETREVETLGDNTQVVAIKSGVEQGDQLVMNPGAFKELMDLPEVKQENRIELPEGVEKVPDGQGFGAAPPAGGGGPGGPGGGFQLPKSGAAMVAEKDTDGDGKLSRDELGGMMGRMLDRYDGDSDGLLSESEADKALAAIRKMMNSRGGPGGGPGGQSGYGRGNGGQ